MTLILVTHFYCTKSNTVRGTVLIIAQSKVAHLLLIQCMDNTAPEVSTLRCSTYTLHTQMTTRKNVYIPYFCIFILYYSLQPLSVGNFTKKNAIYVLGQPFVL